MPTINSKNRPYHPFVLIILDGFGIAPSGPGNAIRLAKLSNLNYYFSHYPYTELKAHGEYVGLFPGEEGNSEAGHINLGAGRIVKQDVVAVSDMIKDGTFFKNAAFLAAFDYVKKNKSNLHFIGLLTGPNSAHAYPEHLDALIKMTRQNKLKQVYLHLFTDGRDSPPFEGYSYLQRLLQKLDPAHEQIATLMGRFYGMDRKKEWTRTELAFNALVFGSQYHADHPLKAVEDGYGRGESDEYIKPTTIYKNNKMLPRIKDNDAIIFFNARSDRARQLTKAFVQDKFNEQNPGSFRRKRKLNNLVFVALTDFGPDLPNILTAYPSPDLKNTLAMELADLRQLYIAETDKYGHLTYFFNGGYADPVAGEERILIKSPDARSYDSVPNMSAGTIADIVVKNIQNKIYDFAAVNFANPDMLGHTGNLSATIKGLEFMDKCVKKIVLEAVDKNRGYVVITADHGNAEEMIDIKTGKVDTQHSIFPVPFCIIGPAEPVRKIKLRSNGILADVAPTILYLMKRDKPQEMTGKNLII
ncbi:phosphoglycerate mutase (2,3-diphosphoglycerate-independent) [Candidatus Kuenenbacteria bacterium RIFCSPHIGHO2_02_FULL_39_13]|uniref:2,3-bisphosphoglycerate-independent phosphoglycerate mutase n=1 Tax=Candidatus Kuenenbacteria bacterium RIFCSPHIGHO2_02_FULL_39_13 TaxID=1798561 RepID=A0A1F6FP32_9BACT|nr:MAG: phosphoglycerate mutase (2,3-diphosphoglycerate-independent) [Candidatus Kuenenbacteria bacterium RIFCSPHIGHO2_02_FULL_39_13]